MQTSEVLTTYTCLYIKHVRQHGYNGSLYSFVKRFGENSYICVLANKVTQELIKQKYIQRTSRTTYRWNTNGKVLLIYDVKTIIQSV